MLQRRKNRIVDVIAREQVSNCSFNWVRRNTNFKQTLLKRVPSDHSASRQKFVSLSISDFKIINCR